ncbi:TadE family protein [Streptomyces sp. NPDC014734]|uniref:TadE family protein n=1 Tax=Streptomyces sp. NPDC014734 TaxID=3364886 RepID=UPI0036FA3033
MALNGTTTDMEIRGRRPGDPPARARGLTSRRLPGGLRARLVGRGRDRGQTAIEFLGMTPLIILIVIVLWQCALIGFTFSLAGNAADQAAHQGAVTESIRRLECQDGAKKDMPKAWAKTMRTTCRMSSSGMYTAKVDLKVPILVPGVLNWSFPVEGNGAYPAEG